MGKDSSSWYDGIIEDISAVSNSLTGSETEEIPDSDRSSGLSLSRRSYLACAGTTAAAVAGCAGRTERSTVQPLTVFGYGGSTVIHQSQSLSMSVTEAEPNDTHEAAMRVDLGTMVSGDLGPSDSDWYAVEISSGQQMAVTFQRSPQTGVTAVIVYDADGVFTNLRYVSTDEEVAFEVTAETSGTHHVQVVDTQSSDGAYTLTLASASATDTPVSTDSGTETTTPTATSTPTTTSTPTATSTADDYGEQGYGEYGYGGIAP